MQKIELERIKMIKDLLEQSFNDPYISVPLVNTVMMILGYAGHFDYNEETGKVRWRINKHDKGMI